MALKLFFEDCSSDWSGALGAFGSAEDLAFQRDASASLFALTGNRSGNFGGGAFPIVEVKLRGSGMFFSLDPENFFPENKSLPEDFSSE